MAARKPPAGRESAVLKGCLAYLRLKGLCVWRNNTGAAVYPGAGGRRRFVRFGVKGLPDILGWLSVPGPGGRPLAVALGVETKRPGGRVRPEQRAFLARLEAAGGAAMLVESVDELIAGLKKWGVR